MFKQFTAGNFSFQKKYWLVSIPVVLVGSYFLFGQSDSANELLAKNSDPCTDLPKDLKKDVSKCENSSQTLITDSKKSTRTDLVNEIKYCELFFDPELKKFTYNFGPWIKFDKNYLSSYYIYKGKEEVVDSWYSLLRKADADKRIEEAKSIASIIRENSVNVYYKDNFSKDFISKLYLDTNAVELCETQRRTALGEYAKSDLIDKITKEERLEIFDKYIRNDSAYVSANEATQTAIRLRFKVPN